MADSPQRNLRRTRDGSSSRRRDSDDEPPKADSSSGPDELDEDGHGTDDNEIQGGRVNGEFKEAGEGVRERRSRLANSGEKNESRTPSPSKLQGVMSTKECSRKFKTAAKPGKSFDEFVLQDEKRGLFEKQKTIEDFEKKPRDVKKKEDVSHGIWMWAALGICLVLGLVFFACQNSQEGNSSVGSVTHELTRPEATWKKLQKSLLRKFKQLNSRYTHQFSATSTHLISAINSTFDISEPRQPSAITLLIPPSLKMTSFPKCFALKYASAVNEMFAEVWKEKYFQQEVKVVNSEYFRVNGDNITGIHEDLKEYFSAGGKVVLVEDVDKLEKEEHFLVFHSFCDNFKAPHKRATFMFLLDVPNSVAAKYSWNYSQAADISYSALLEAWTSTVSDDHRAAMIARVAATAVLLNDGDSC